MTAPAITDVLRETQFTALLAPDVLVKLARIASLRTYAKGELLCREGQMTSDLHVIHSGHVALEMFIPGRGQIRILTLGPGEIVGWSAIIGSHGATTSARCLEETQTVVLPSADLLTLCRADHDVGFSVMKGLASAISQRLIATRLQMLDIFAHEPLDATLASSTGSFAQAGG